ncbi:MAG: ImuA family protein [Kordiimonas sp.]
MQQTAQNDNTLAPQESTATFEGKGTRVQQLDALRQTIRDLEQIPANILANEAPSSKQTITDNAESFLTGYSHEIWAARPSDYGAAMGYALQTLTKSNKPTLWITTYRMIQEHGMPYGPGLLAHSLDPNKIIIVRCKDEQQALWAIEEGLKSKALSTVVGELTQIDLTSSRRLSLVCREHGTCSITILRHDNTAPTACYTRQKIEPIPSNTTMFAPQAPGAMRLSASLIKHRAGIRPTNTIMEWHHAQDHLPMAPTLANRALDACEPPKIATR